jgi:hypothetical protein
VDDDQACLYLAGQVSHAFDHRMLSLLSALAKRQELPSEFHIPEMLELSFSEMWRKSAAAPFHEWGAAICLQRGGLVTSPLVEGTETSLSFKNVLKSEGTIGVFHTHLPYDSGVEGVAFSGKDFDFLATHNLSISIVQSGIWRFAAVKKTPTIFEKLKL